jgi:long-chain fatty acid transport protein
MISVALGGRFLYAKETGKVTTDTSVAPLFLGDTTTLVDYEKTASGFGGIIGLNISPLSGLNIGIRYETITKLEFEYDKADGPLASSFGAVKGAKEDRDLPSLLGLGVSYQLIPELRADASFTYYLNSKADWDGAEDEHKNGYEIGAAAEYSILSNLKASLGFLYTNQGADKDSYVYLNPALKAISVCGGGIYEVTPGLSLELGISGSFYLEDDGTTEFAQPVTLNKKVLNIALGASYKIF